MKYFNIVVFVFLNYFGLFATGLELRDGGYEDLVVSISDTVSATNCKEILHNLEVRKLFVLFQIDSIV